MKKEQTSTRVCRICDEIFLSKSIKKRIMCPACVLRAQTDGPTFKAQMIITNKPKLIPNGRTSMDYILEKYRKRHLEKGDWEQVQWLASLTDKELKEHLNG